MNPAVAQLVAFASLVGPRANSIGWAGIMSAALMVWRES